MAFDKTCEAPNCGAVFPAQREAARFCSARCRQRYKRAPKDAAPAPGGARVVSLPTPPREGGLTAAARAELTKADRLDTALGQNALLLAEELERRRLLETGQSLAALEKSFRSAYAEALRDAEAEVDELDDLRRQAFTVIAGGRV